MNSSFCVIMAQNFFDICLAIFFHKLICITFRELNFFRKKYSLSNFYFFHHKEFDFPEKAIKKVLLYHSHNFERLNERETEIKWKRLWKCENYGNFYSFRAWKMEKLWKKKSIFKAFPGRGSVQCRYLYMKCERRKTHIFWWTFLFYTFSFFIDIFIIWGLFSKGTMFDCFILIMNNNCSNIC
jgi:hypothetical protein